MYIFLASRFANKSKMCTIREMIEAIEENGAHLHRVIATWLSIDSASAPPLHPQDEIESVCRAEYDRTCANMDSDDIARVHLLIADLTTNGEGPGSCGALVEIGIALGKRIPVWVVGDFPTVYRRHKLVRQMGGWEEVLCLLAYRDPLSIEWTRG